MVTYLSLPLLVSRHIHSEFHSKLNHSLQASLHDDQVIGDARGILLDGQAPAAAPDSV